MNVSILALVALPLFFLAFRFYSRYLSKRYGEDPNRPTPAIEFNDGKDYCPTKTPVVFGHHFASIAGAGPILGPTIALLYGVVPVWLWIILGGILIGAVHDYTTLFASLREKGKSIAEIAKKSLGDTGFALVIAFTIIMIVLVTSAFLVASARALTSLVPLKILGLPPSQTIFKTVIKNGVEMGKIGGIASMSAIVITALAPILGYLNYKRKASVAITAPLAIGIALFSVFIGIHHPVSLPQRTWMVLLASYSFIAAGIPVWLILQPRDYTNVFILYGGIIFLVIATFSAGISGVRIEAPLFNVHQGISRLGLIWPFLFVIVACGAISGFHALVAGGTSAKQVTSERSARLIGYGGMLLESILAIGVIAAISAGIAFKDYLGIVFPAKAGASNPILGFALGMGGLLNKGLGIPFSYGSIFGILMVEGFIATTLDTAVRLNRYLFEELWGIIFKGRVPGIMRYYLFNSGLSVVIMLFLALTNAFLAIWPIFGTANQLLAALTLITLTVWLILTKRKAIFTAIPAGFMLVTTLFSLIFLFKRYLTTHNTILLVADAGLFLLAIALTWVAVKTFRRLRESIRDSQAI